MKLLKKLKIHKKYQLLIFFIFFSYKPIIALNKNQSKNSVKLEKEIFAAIKKGDESLTSTLLNYVNINAKNSLNECSPSLLHYAVYNGHLNIVKLLLSKEANIESTDCKLSTPLITACHNWTRNKDGLAIVKILIDYGANVNTLNKDKQTPLMLICEHGNFQIAKLLIANGANINAINKYKRTPLMIACDYGNFEIAKLLIIDGANIALFDNFHNNAQAYCKTNELIKLLVIAQFYYSIVEKLKNEQFQMLKEVSNFPPSLGKLIADYSIENIEEFLNRHNI